MKKNWENIISIIVLASFIFPIFYIVYKIIVAPTINIDNVVGLRIKTDYSLMLVQCILGIVAMLLPSMISKKINIKIPSNIYLFYIIFLYAAIFLGELRSFYYRVPHWDTILHTFSGFMLGALGFSFVHLLNKEESIYFKLSPRFIAFFAFCFAVTLGVIWEIYEFSFDRIIGIKYAKICIEKWRAINR